MTCGQQRLSVVIHFPICTIKIAIPTDNLFSIWIPYNQLLVTAFHHIKIVNIHRLSRSSACISECNFAQSANLFHDIGRVLSRNDINFVMAFISHSELFFRRQLTFQHLFCYRPDNFFFHLLSPYSVFGYRFLFVIEQ